MLRLRYQNVESKIIAELNNVRYNYKEMSDCNCALRRTLHRIHCWRWFQLCVYDFSLRSVTDWFSQASNFLSLWIIGIPWLKFQIYIDFGFQIYEVFISNITIICWKLNFISSSSNFFFLRRYLKLFQPDLQLSVVLDLHRFPDCPTR